MATQTFVLQDDQQVQVTVSEVDDAGNPVPPTAGIAPSFAVSDPAILSVTPDPTNPFSASVSANGPIGSAQLTVSAGALAPAVVNIDVTASAAVSLAVAFAPPTHK